MIDFCVLGSGIAGSTIANFLSKKYSVHVFDKARGPGGRSSNKRFKNNNNFIYHIKKMKPKCNQCPKCFKLFSKRKEYQLHELQHLQIKKTDIDSALVGECILISPSALFSSSTIVISIHIIPIGGLLIGLGILAAISIIQLVVIILLIVYILYSRHKDKVHTYRLLYTQY